MQTRKQNDRINSGSRTINSPCPWELLSSHLFRAGISSRDVTLLWRALPVFVLPVRSSSSAEKPGCDMPDLSCGAELLRPRSVSDGHDSHASAGVWWEEPAQCVVLLI